MRYTYRLILLLVSIVPLYSAPRNHLQPTVSVAPLWIMADYGLYWGFTVSGEATIKRYHRIVVSADLAPWGLLGMSDVDTRGKEQHWGGTLSYLVHFEFGDFLRINPGVTAGLASIPYIYGTLYPLDTASTPSVTSRNKPEREYFRALGPELRISLGRRTIHFLADGRLLVSPKRNFAFLTNIGISIRL